MFGAYRYDFITRIIQNDQSKSTVTQVEHYVKREKDPSLEIKDKYIPYKEATTIQKHTGILKMDNQQGPTV